MRQASGVKGCGYLTQNPFHVESFCRRGDRPREGKNLPGVPRWVSGKARPGVQGSIVGRGSLHCSCCSKGEAESRPLSSSERVRVEPQRLL